MERVDTTKPRLIREAIRDNLEGTRRSKLKVVERSRRILPLSLLGSLLIGSLAYLSVPAQVLSRGTASSPDPDAVEVTALPAPLADQAAPRDAARPVPRRLSRAVLPLSVKRIVLDPGHGGAQHGAISDSGVSEKEITLDIALRLRRLMERAPFEVMMTRETDQTIPLEQRVAFANANRADLFVSIHVNWITRREIRPLETYYVGPTEDPVALRRVSMENRDSGYSLSAYRRLLEKIYLDTRRDESHTLARTINTELYRSLSEVNPELENRGVKMAPFVVLVGTEMPAILVEVSCLSNEDDVGLLTRADYREKIAVALMRGIRSYANDLDGFNRKGG